MATTPSATWGHFERIGVYLRGSSPSQKGAQLACSRTPVAENPRKSLPIRQVGRTSGPRRPPAMASAIRVARAIGYGLSRPRCARCKIGRGRRGTAGAGVNRAGGVVVRSRRDAGAGLVGRGGPLHGLSRAWKAQGCALHQANPAEDFDYWAGGPRRFGAGAARAQLSAQCRSSPSAKRAASAWTVVKAAFADVRSNCVTLARTGQRCRRQARCAGDGLKPGRCSALPRRARSRRRTRCSSKADRRTADRRGSGIRPRDGAGQRP